MSFREMASREVRGIVFAQDETAHLNTPAKGEIWYLEKEDYGTCWIVALKNDREVRRFNVQTLESIHWKTKEN